MESQSAVFAVRSKTWKKENKGSAFKDGEYREFCWQWCLVMIMLNPKKSNPNREYEKRLWKGEQE